MKPDYKGFALKMFEDWPEPYGENLDGFELQGLGEKYGILTKSVVTEPCQPEGCNCAEFGFPTDCYRVNRELKK